MARTKEFDEVVALGKALELFRERGYGNTSFSDLTTRLGISRQSLYDTFGDKHDLFLAALTRYLDAARAQVRHQLEKEGKLNGVMEELFGQLIHFSCDNGAHGCLLVNSLVELAPEDPCTQALAVQHARAMEAMFSSRISQAQARGEVPADKNPATLATFLYHTLIGLSVAARAKEEPTTLMASARLALRVLQ